MSVNTDKIVLNWIIMTIYTSNSIWSNWIIMTIYTSNSFWSNQISSSIFIWIPSEYFPTSLSHLKRSFHSKTKTCLKSLYRLYCPSVFWSNWQSNTTLDGPLINQSNRLFITGYTIKLLTGLSMNFNFRKLVIHNKYSNSWLIWCGKYIALSTSSDVELPNT